MGKIKINKEMNKKYAYHELLDRTNIIQSLIEGLLSSSPILIQDEPEILQMIERVQDILGHVYQEIGSKGFDFIETEND